MLERARYLGKVSKDCKLLGYSKEQFYEISGNLQTFGSAGLTDRVSGAKNPHPNRVSEEVENAVRDLSLKFPTQGLLRIAQFLTLQGREKHIEARYSVSLVAIDTFMVSVLKGECKIYLQTAIDFHSRYAFGRQYTSKIPVTAVHLLNADILPFFEAEEVKIEAKLSDNGREYCGRTNNHLYRLFFQLKVLEYKTTKVRWPQSDEIAERLNRTLF